MPPYFAGQQFGLLEELLLVVFAEVKVRVGRGVEGEDVVGGFEFGDGDETRWKGG